MPDLLRLTTPAHEAVRQAESFWTGGWTDEHTGWFLVALVMLAIWWGKPGGTLRR